MAKRSVARPDQKVGRPPFKVSGAEGIFLESVLMAFRAMSERSQDRALALAASIYEDLKGTEGGGK